MESCKTPKVEVRFSLRLFPSQELYGRDSRFVALVLVRREDSRAVDYGRTKSIPLHSFLIVRNGVVVLGACSYPHLGRDDEQKANTLIQFGGPLAARSAGSPIHKVEIKAPEAGRYILAGDPFRVPPEGINVHFESTIFHPDKGEVTLGIKQSADTPRTN